MVLIRVPIGMLLHVLFRLEYLQPQWWTGRLGWLAALTKMVEDLVDHILLAYGDGTSA